MFLIFQLAIALIFGLFISGYLIYLLKKNTKRSRFIAKSIFGFGVMAIVVLLTLKRLNSKIEISREDIYGEYIIDRSKFSGPQADWQYNHFRFVITPTDSFYFYETEGKKILKTHRGTVHFLEVYNRPRIVIEMDRSSHHIIESEPTLYRNTWDFNYVFKSPKFKNVFFKKGEWDALDGDD